MDGKSSTTRVWVPRRPRRLSSTLRGLAHHRKEFVWEGEWCGSMEDMVALKLHYLCKCL